MNKVDLDPWRLDSRLRLLLEGMDHPDIRVDLDRVKHTKSIAAISRGNLKDTAIDAMERLCLPDFPPTAATVSASSMSLWTSFGNSSKSLRAALIQEIFLLSRIPETLANLPTSSKWGRAHTSIDLTEAAASRRGGRKRSIISADDTRSTCAPMLMAATIAPS